jgi:hypothetical protein
MSKIILFRTIALSLLITAASCSSSKHSNAKRLPGTWQIEPIAVDGSNKDWPSPYPDYDEKAMLGYAVSNDSKNLYISVETGDLATQLKILRGGLTVWIDKTGGTEQVTAVNYPLPNEKRYDKHGGEAEDRPAAGQWQQGNGSSADKQRMAIEDKVQLLLADAKEFSLQGFKSCNLQYPLLEKDTCGIVVRMNIDADNEMVWEAVIPLKSFYYKGELEKRDNGKAMSICIETIGQKRPAGGGGGGNRGGSGNGGGGGFRPSIGFGGMGGIGMGMGMRSGGGRGGSRNGGSGTGSQLESLYKNTTTWKKFGLAYPQK